MSDEKLPKIILLQFGVELTLSYYTLKKYLETNLDEKIKFDLMSFRAWFPVIPSKKFIQHTKFVPITLFLLMYKNVKEGFDIFHLIEEKWKNVNQNILDVDFNLLRRIKSEVEERIDEIYKYDIFGVYVTFEGILHFIITILLIKSRYPEKPIISGGPYFKTHSEFFELLYENKLINSNVIDDGEISLLEIVNSHLNNVPLKKEYDNPVKDLDILPIPNPSFTNCTVNGIPAANISTSRGCFKRCAFCRITNTRFEVFSNEYISDWINKYYHDYGITRFYICDSIFSRSKKFIFSFYESLLEKNLVGKIHFDFAWIAPEIIDEEVLKILKNLNMHLEVGIESFSQKVLNKLNKRTNVEDNLKKIFLIQKYNFSYHLTDMFGFPGETWEEFIHSAGKFKTFGGRKNTFANYFTLIPGIPIYRNPKDYNIELVFFPESDILNDYNHHISKTFFSYINHYDLDNSLYHRKLKMIKMLKLNKNDAYIKTRNTEWVL